MASSLLTHSCTVGKAHVAAVCGTIRVVENRQTNTGRQIGVHFILLKAKHPTGHVIYIDLGGPASELAAAPDIADGNILKELAALRDHYDELMIDRRGFGLSHPMRCNLAPASDPATYFAHEWPTALLEKCHADAARTTDVAQYNTLAAAADLNELRAALGYKKLIFDAGSYGTFFAFHFMRAYPQYVESAVLMANDPPGFDDQDRQFAQGVQTSFDRLVAECDADAICRKNFPQFRKHFFALLARMTSHTLAVQFRNPATKRVQAVGLSREVFVDTIRHLLYEPEAASFVPIIIDQAYTGKTLALGNIANLNATAFLKPVDEGAFLSYTCSEFMPFTGSPQALAYARTTWYGTSRGDAQRAACVIWNVPAMPESFDQPVRSDLPVLMINGSDDPATPPSLAKQELPYLSRGALMLVRGAPHTAESPCTDAAAERFIRSASAKGINLNGCSANYKRPPFATTLPAWLQ